LDTLLHPTEFLFSHRAPTAKASLPVADELGEFEGTPTRASYIFEEIATVRERIPHTEQPPVADIDDVRA